MKKSNIKKSAIIKLIILLVVICSIVSIIMYINYKNSNGYKLKEIGYNKTEVKEILEITTKEQIEKILTIEYNSFIIGLLQEKYFIWNNFDNYLAYKKEINDKSLTDVVAIVNVKANNKWYDENVIKEADLSKENLILVNKFNYLKEDYIPENLMNVSDWYAYANNKLKEVTYDAFIELFKAAEEAGYKIIANESYRSYTKQDDTYHSYITKGGQAWADSFAAKPGFSEHQTGLSIDIGISGTEMDNFHEFEESKWLEENAHKYGFILRYPDGKKYLTGYDYEPWHYRYVGEKVAKEIKELGITFDEYYAYFLR